MENQNQSPKQQLIERLKQANNVLVTVSKNPSVDQLSAAIGLTLMLNHIDKHATAVFSGDVPNTLEFLKPDETLEQNTDSLRDFIISLDKSKADKLRYKVEDKMVKIFITPYRTSLSEADLVFGQGDFNVDVVVAIGVHEKEDLDDAITSHGRILHDATVATVNTVMSGQLGSINWIDAKASSLSEMLVPVCESLKADALDAQMATAFLTGIVAETDRFSNEKTSSDTMNISAKLMAAGANQQLVATQLEKVPEPVESAPKTEVDLAEDAVEAALGNDGSLEITHEVAANPESETEVQAPEQTEEQQTDLPELKPEHVEEQNSVIEDENPDKPSRLILEPPTMGGKLTANTEPEGLDPSTDPLTVKPPEGPLLSHDKDEPKPVETNDTSTDDDIDSQEPVIDNPVTEPSEDLGEKTEEISLPPLPDAPVMPISDEGLQTPPSEPQILDEPAVVLAPSNEVPAEAQQSEESTEAEEDQTLTDIETAVGSPHTADAMVEEHEAEKADVPDIEAALAAAHEALDATTVAEKPAAFNASGPMEVPHDEPALQQPELPAEPPEPSVVNIDPSTGMLSYPTNLVPPSQGLPIDPTAASVEDPTAPPPVPPPMPMPPIDPNNLPPVAQ